MGEMKPWQNLASKLADKLMDLANFTAGALIIGQLISGRPFDWAIAGLGLGVLDSTLHHRVHCGIIRPR